MAFHSLLLIAEAGMVCRKKEQMNTAWRCGVVLCGGIYIQIQAVWKAKNSDVCGGNYGYTQQLLLEAGQEAFLEDKKPGKS